MNVLQELGVQQWRLRGRKPVAAANVEARLAVGGGVERPRAPSLSASHYSGEPAVSDTLSAGQPPILSPHNEPKSELAGHLLQQDSAQQKPINVIAGQSLETAATKSHDAPVSLLPTSELVTASPEKAKTSVDDIEMPTLRPAPVPLESSAEIDLSRVEPESSEPEDVVSESMAREGEYFAPMPDYNDADIPPVGFDEGDAVSVYDTMSDAVSGQDMGHSGRLESVIPNQAYNGPENESKPTELSQFDWRALQARISNDSACPSCGQQRSVLGFGDVLADWMFIADAPTTPELQAQQLFVGRAAQLFEGILSACGLRREQVYSTTIFKCSPPEDLSLSPQCDKIIHRQVDLVQPKVIVTFGELSSQSVLRANEPFEQLRKGRHLYAGTSCLVITSYTPQHLLANPALKAELWKELKFAMQGLA